MAFSTGGGGLKEARQEGLSSAFTAYPDRRTQFQLLARDLASEGSEVYAIDLRGFGNSVEEGLPLGDTRNFQRHLQDLDEIVENVRRKHQGKEVFMLGYSIGGNYALWYAAHHPGSLDGLILLAPGARINSRIPPRDMLGFMLAFIFASVSSSYELERTLPENVKQSKEYQALKEDPLIPRRLKLRYFGRLRPLLTKIFENASRVDKPTLILQGQIDVWVQPSGAEELFERITVKDKSIETFAEANHDFFHLLFPMLAAESDLPKQREVSGTINRWLQAH